MQICETLLLHHVLEIHTDYQTLALKCLFSHSNICNKFTSESFS